MNTVDKVLIPYGVFLDLICAASLAKGYLTAGTPTAHEIATKLGTAIEIALDKKEFQ